LCYISEHKQIIQHYEKVRLSNGLYLKSAALTVIAWENENWWYSRRLVKGLDTEYTLDESDNISQYGKYSKKSQV